MAIISFIVETSKSVPPFWSCCFCKTMFKSTVVISIHYLCSLMLSVDESGQQHSFFPYKLESSSFPGVLDLKVLPKENTFWGYSVFHQQYNIQSFLDRNTFKDLQTTKNCFFYCVNHCRFNNINCQSNDLLYSFIMACFPIVIVISALLYFYRLCLILVD